MSEAGQMQEVGSGEDFAGWLYCMFVTFALLPGWCDWATIARVCLFCQVFSKSISRALGEGGVAAGGPLWWGLNDTRNE